MRRYLAGFGTWRISNGSGEGGERSPVVESSASPTNTGSSSSGTAGATALKQLPEQPCAHFRGQGHTGRSLESSSEPQSPQRSTTTAAYATVDWTTKNATINADSSRTTFRRRRAQGSRAVR